MTAFATLAAVVGAALLTACEPPPPRTTLVVNSTVSAPDIAPGDGVCADLAGACNLTAALQEAGALATGVDITLPTGRYHTISNVTGDVRINWDAPQQVQITGTLTVQAGARLAMDGINTEMPTPPPPWGLTVVVAGDAHVLRSLLFRLEVAAGGTAALDRSLVADGTANGATTVINRGTLVAINSTLVGYPDADSLVLDNTGGRALLRSSVIAAPTVHVNGDPWVTGGVGTCVGGTFETFGYVHIEVPCTGVGSEVTTGDTGAISDITATLPGPQARYAMVLPASSPLVDAIPLDDPDCAAGLTDLAGTLRGVDGNGDGTGGCDIGGFERPAA